MGHAVLPVQGQEHKGKENMVGNGKANTTELPSDNFMLDTLLPGLFTVILLCALTYLGLSVQAYVQHTAGGAQNYAISAFAN